MTALDDIRSEARQIIQMVAAARRDHPNHGRTLKPTAATIGEIARAMESRPAHISQYSTPLEAFMLGARYWASRAAPQITFLEWQTMADDMAELFSEHAPLIDPISFLENLFEGLETSDGALIRA